MGLKVSSPCGSWGEQRGLRAVSVRGPYKAAAAAGLGESHTPGGSAWLAGPGRLPRPNGNT